MKINKICGSIDISIIIPAYNEEENVLIIHEEVFSVMEKLNKSYEIIFVDDGSTDKTCENLKMIKEKDRKTKIINFRKNFGQTAAIDAGIRNSSGNIMITMDSDLQNDPDDIPKLLTKLDEGYDVVSGWRFDRKDSFPKKFISKTANFLRKLIINDLIHDSGCSLKAYRRECLENVRLYGEMHRFIPALVQLKGFKVTEIKVNHRKRKYGKTKYNIKRTLNGFLDMLLIKFWMSYSTKPIHLFGGLGIITGLSGFILGSYLTYIKLIYGELIGNRPLLLLSALLIITGLILFIFGLLADIIMRIYYREEENYSITNKNE